MLCIAHVDAYELRKSDMSIEINIKDAVKRYGDVTVIPGLSVDIGKGEFFTLLGPSGCGKTTLLRMIAGFNTFEGGDLYFNNERINDLEPSKRKIGMVFQNYAIFPHMTVRKNVEFGLRNLGFDRRKIRGRAEKFLDLVQIGHLADRMPDQLSGGQQQRVALARALCPEPDVLLMDEPLSNLDAKLRVEMRMAIKDIQKSVGTTTVYVTHDQEEAMAISDRIAVMRDGTIQHLGTPQEIYHRPANHYVSSFIGRSNTLEGVLLPSGELNVAEHTFEVPEMHTRPESALPVRVGIRPEEFTIDQNATTGILGRIEDITFLGLHIHYLVRLTDDSTVEVVQESEYPRFIPEGTDVYLDINARKINVFSADGEENLLRPGSDAKASAASV